MSLTPYHAKYFAHDLTRRAASAMDRLSMALFDAAVDLNPQQIEAALFQVEDEIVEKRDSLIESLERRLTQHTETDTLFTIRCAVV